MNPFAVVTTSPLGSVVSMLVGKMDCTYTVPAEVNVVADANRSGAVSRLLRSSFELFGAPSLVIRLGVSLACEGAGIRLKIDVVSWDDVEVSFEMAFPEKLSSDVDVLFMSLTSVPLRTGPL